MSNITTPAEKGHLQRLHKVIAFSGVTSRRKAEGLIRQGRVKVNGEVVQTLGFKVDPENDSIMVDGNMIDPSHTEKIYLVLNKPRGHMTTLFDPEGRKTVMDLVKDIPIKIFPVGRLDYNSEGLLIMTNDGEFAQKVIHPSSNITKVYEVKVFGIITERILNALREGLKIENRFVKPKSVRVIKQLPHKTWLEFRIMEGKNREIRRFCEAQGLTVDKLRRVAIEGLSIDGIPLGHYKIFSEKSLLKSLGLSGTGTFQAAPALKYKSAKKTVKFPKRGNREGQEADDKAFIKYRKQHYRKTMEFRKEEALKREADPSENQKKGKVRYTINKNKKVTVVRTEVGRGRRGA